MLDVSPLRTCDAAARADTAGRRIAIYSESPEPSGMGAHMLDLAAELARTCSVHLAAPAVPGTRRLRHAAAAAGVVVSALPARRPKAPPRPLFVRAWLRRARPDVLHLHAGVSWEALGVPRLARAEGVERVVRTEHLPHMRPARAPAASARSYALMLSELDALICVSESVAATYKAAGVPDALLRIALNGVRPPAAQARAAARDALGLPPDRLVVLSVARFSDQKGWWQWLDVVALAMAKRPHVLFLAAGEGPIWRWIVQAARQRGLGDAVRFLGARDDVPRLMAAADALLMTSWFEGHPLVALEAMFAGLPIAAFDAPGVSEAVSHGATGLLAPRGDSAALAGAVLNLLSDRIGAERLRRAARADAQARFRSEHMAARLTAIYDEEDEE